jgi:hypothetical protein
MQKKQSCTHTPISQELSFFLYNNLQCMRIGERKMQEMQKKQSHHSHTNKTRALSLFLLSNSLQCMRIRKRTMPGDAEEAKPPLTHS